MAACIAAAALTRAPRGPAVTSLVRPLQGYGAQKFVFQGVHETICYGPAESKWKDGDARINQIVFIGRSLDRRVSSSASSGDEGQQWGSILCRGLGAWVLLLVCGWVFELAGGSAAAWAAKQRVRCRGFGLHVGVCMGGGGAALPTACPWPGLGSHLCRSPRVALIVL